jgi:hypothetical protein
LKTLYSPEYDALPKGVQQLFLTHNEKLKKTGDLRQFDRQGWAYFLDVDRHHTAMGNLREDENVFYWVLIGPSSGMPVIL